MGAVPKSGLRIGVFFLLASYQSVWGEGPNYRPPSLRRQPGCTVRYQALLLGNRLPGSSDTYPEYRNYNDAMSAALQWLKKRGFTGDLNYSQGKFAKKFGGVSASFEFKDPAGHLIKVRVERHPLTELGGVERNHINVSFGQEDGPHFLFPGGETDLRALLRQLGVWQE